MNRKPKFRGRRTSGQWVRGLVCHYPRMGQVCTPDWFIYDKDGRPYAYSVDPSTLGQWTGMVDHRGEEIYEDDIVQVGSSHKQVVYTPEKACFSLKNELPLHLYKHIPMRVVGNIHDHPHLLEEMPREEEDEEE